MSRPNFSIQTASSSLPLNLFISNNECGVTQVKSSDPNGLNSSLVLHLLHDDELNTAEDRAYLLQCFIGAQNQDAVVSTNLNVVRSELAIAETISLSTLPPTCTYSIRKEGPEGPIVSRAVVGQTVWHRWECDGTNDTNQAYGIQVSPLAAISRNFQSKLSKKLNSTPLFTQWGNFLRL